MPSNKRWCVEVHIPYYLCFAPSVKRMLFKTRASANKFLWLNFGRYRYRYSEVKRVK